MTITIPQGAAGADFVSLTAAMKAWLLARDVEFVLRYSVPPETTRIGKDIGADEVAWHHAHGIAVLLNWEINPTDGSAGAPGGHRAGTWLKARAAELGCPTDVPLFASIDTDTWRANIVAHEAYVRAFAAAIAPHRVGVYGDDDIAYAVRDLFPVYWRANASGWDGEARPVTVHIQQHRALYPPGVDPNTCVTPFPAWLPAIAPTKPAPPTEEPDMNPRYIRVNDRPAVWVTTNNITATRVDAEQFAALGNPTTEVITEKAAKRFGFVDTIDRGVIV